MEGQMKKYRQVSPERAKVWTEKPPKYHQNLKVPVVYYLCRNRQLEHPHFMEVPLSSPDGLYLRDVIDRLNSLRGRGMASLYSWSCKRSYKNGFVWHDLCEDDLILPAHGNEYVLKGSELFDESNSDRFSHINDVKIQSVKLLPGPASCRSHDEASSSYSMNGKETRHSQDDELSQEQHTGSFDVSPESSAEKSDPVSLALTEQRGLLSLNKVLEKSMFVLRDFIQLFLMLLRFENDIDAGEEFVLMTTKGEAISLGIAEMTTAVMAICDHGVVAKIKRLATENQRLAATHGVLRQELAGA
ncbi:unnamed protein product [Lathyrus sativus]|nr:unnamed protein product [Lathyrus sativus]